MRRKFCLLFLTVGLLLGLAAPSQAGTPTVSPTLLDFGSFTANAPPSGLLSATVTVPAGPPTRYFAGLKMASGQANFFPSADCPEASPINTPCHVNVRVVTPVTGSGSLTGVVEVLFSEDQSEVPKIVEAQGIAVQANVTAGSTTTTPPPGSPNGNSGNHHKKKKCKGPSKKGKRNCGKHKGKGKTSA